MVLEKKHSLFREALVEESVWDYPRPARCEPFEGVIVIEHGGQIVARTQGAFRVIETSHPPSYYLPTKDIDMSLLHPNNHHTLCEWKGRANYYDMVIGGELIRDIGWAYHEPTPTFQAMADYIAFYPSKMESCWVNGERVQAQEGDFYGGWITSNLKGPFKGPPGSEGW